MSHNLHPHHLRRVKLNDLHPTQIAVGEIEVEHKRREWAPLSKQQRRKRLDSHVFPAVLGPMDVPYIVDHHHLGLALQREDVDEIWISVLDELSWLNKTTFWRTMEFRAWTHPYDARGMRQDYDLIPRRLADLQDDPHRSLAALVRDAGGFAKSPVPFAEFLWADFFRAHFPRQRLAKNPQGALREALALSHADDARYLPGWTRAQP